MNMNTATRLVRTNLNSYVYAVRNLDLVPLFVLTLIAKNINMINKKLVPYKAITITSLISIHDVIFSAL